MLQMFEMVIFAICFFNSPYVYFSRAIWLGDLNYRISLSYEDTKKLLTENNWDALFEKDQVSY